VDEEALNLIQKGLVDTMKTSKSRRVSMTGFSSRPSFSSSPYSSQMQPHTDSYSVLDDVKVHYNQEHTEFNAARDGFDFFEVRNTLMCSYLVDIIHLISLQCENKKGDGEKSDTDMIATKGRLQEMKVILEKIRPMNQKLAYQTKKLLSLADTITAVERSNKDDNDKEEEIDYVHNILKQQEYLSSFGPNPEALMDSEDDEDAEDDPGNG